MCCLLLLLISVCYTREFAVGASVAHTYTMCLIFSSGHFQYLGKLKDKMNVCRQVIQADVDIELTVRI